MTQVFISYSRSERPVAARLAERLGEAGYDVWWDAELVGGQRFEEEIQAALKAASAAIVLWSHASTASDWVRAEAEIARVARTAVPVLIDDVSIDALPLVFRALHTIDLRNWNGDPAAAGFRDILSAIGKLSGTPPEPRPAIASHYPPPGTLTPTRQRPSLGVIAAAAIAMVALIAGFVWWQLKPPVAACPADQLVRLTTVPLSLCVDPAWVASAGNSDTSLEYKQAGAIVRIVSSPEVVDPSAIRNNIIGTAQRIAGDPAKIVVVRDAERELGGKTWKFVEFTNAGVADFVDYYYSTDGFGSIHVQVVGTIAALAQRDKLVAPLLESIRFTS